MPIFTGKQTFALFCRFESTIEVIVFPALKTGRTQEYWISREVTTMCEASIMYVYTGHFQVMVIQYPLSTPVRAIKFAHFGMFQLPRLFHLWGNLLSWSGTPSTSVGTADGDR